MRIKLNNVRLAFASVFEKDKYGRHSATFLINPDTKEGKAAIKEIEKGMKTVAEEKWGDKAKKLLPQLQKKERVCYGDGDDKPDYDGFEGNMFLKASNKKRITLVDREKVPVEEDDGVIYSGCYVNATVDLWAQDQEEGGKRINASLRGIQFYKGGDAFGGGQVASVDEFDDLGDLGDDDEDLDEDGYEDEDDDLS